MLYHPEKFRAALELLDSVHGRGEWGKSAERKRNYVSVRYSLTATHSHDETRPHDKVFSVLGGLARSSRSMVELNDLLKPKHIATISEIYTRVTWLLIREKPCLSKRPLVEDAILAA